MANGSYAVKEIRFVIEDELTQVYVLLDADHECPVGVQGWHHKTYPASKSVSEILMEAFTGKDEDPVLWPLNAPRR